MLNIKNFFTGFVTFVFIGVSSSVFARDTINIVGSSTVYPFATVVAEKFGKGSQFRVPKIESTGSGGGLKLFCQGLGVNTPDITNASRKIKASEIELCKKNSVNEIVEVKIGYDGIAIANSKKSAPVNLTLKEIFLALAKNVPNDKGKLIPNPYTHWNQINSNLPNQKIEVLGPPPTSGTRDAFVELAMEGGCKAFPSILKIKKEDKAKYKAVCHAMREDGAYIEAGENDNLIVKKLEKNPNAFGIFGFSFLEQNLDKVHGSKINNIEPNFSSIGDGKYPISRSLYFYVKKAHLDVIPGLKEYVLAFTSKNAIGPDGYLTDRGLIPLAPSEWKIVRNDTETMKTNI
ncbi:PstS family phosphate ABC transporter substrate-binding protein [Paraphotobacterium marinum]|uniref:PstS family phosphate ABC transporter substrate-binding protein n=1 Tax=Paraphotobacterium marinum TaxID=1755811 RepID=UPI0039ED41AD